MAKTAGDGDGKTAGTLRRLLLLAGTAQAAPEKIIIDTDIGDDIDDAFAVALALKSPELEVVGVMSDFGDTELRARMLDRLLADTGHRDIPVAVGIASDTNPSGFSQRRYAEAAPAKAHPPAVDFLLEQIRRHPGEITLVAIGPSPNLGAAIDRDPATFRRLKAIVMMGGSFHPVSDGFGPATPPHPEWNIKSDIAAAQKIFASGVPLFVMPLDSTVNLKLDEVARTLLFAHGTPMTDMLALSYHQWAYGTHGVTPHPVRSHDRRLSAPAVAVPGDAAACAGGRYRLHPRRTGRAQCAGLPQVRPGRLHALHSDAPDAMTLQQLFASAAAAQAAGQLTEAERLYREALTHAPVPEMLVNHGNLLARLGRREEALERYDLALAGNPGLVPALYNRGNVLQELKRLEDALASFDGALARQRDLVGAWNNRGTVLRGLRRLDEALASIEQALALAPGHVNALTNRAMLLWDMKRFEAALAAADKALAAQPGFGEALYLRGNILTDLHRPHEALESYEAALAATPDHPHALNGAARTALALCDWQRSAALAPRLRDAVTTGRAVIQPFTLLGYCDDAALQLRCAEN